MDEQHVAHQHAAQQQHPARPMEVQALSFGWGRCGQLGLGSSIKCAANPRCSLTVLCEAPSDWVFEESGPTTASLLPKPVQSSSPEKSGVVGKEQSRRLVPPMGRNSGFVGGCGSKCSFVALADGRIFSWGKNEDGQLGLGDPDGVLDAFAQLSVATPTLTPTTPLQESSNLRRQMSKDAPSPAGSREQSADRFVKEPGTNAVSFTGASSSWPVTGGGTRGTERTTCRLKDEIVPEAERTVLSCRGSHVVALDARGRAFAWGSNQQGEAGRPLQQPSTLPKLVKTRGVRFVSVLAGRGFSAGLTEDGRVFTWGGNEHGELGRGAATTPFQGTTNLLHSGGDGHDPNFSDTSHIGTMGVVCVTTTSSSEWQPGLVTFPDASFRAQLMAAGSRHMVVGGKIRDAANGVASGAMFSWGWNVAGQLGEGTRITAPSPRRVLLRVESRGQTSRSDSDRSLSSIGEGIFVGNGNASSSAGEQLGHGPSWKQRAYSTARGEQPSHTRMLTRSAGSDTSEAHTTVVRQPPVTHLACGFRHTLVVCGGRLYGFGSNENGELGLGANSKKFVTLPTVILAMPPKTSAFSGGEQAPPVRGVSANSGSGLEEVGGGGFSHVAGGGRHSLVVLEHRKLLVAGLNQDGQLGLGDYASRCTFTAHKDVALGATICSVAAGYAHSLLLVARPTTARLAGSSTYSTNVGTDVATSSAVSTVDTDAASPTTQLRGDPIFDASVDSKPHRVAVLAKSFIQFGKIAWGVVNLFPHGVMKTPVVEVDPVPDLEQPLLGDHGIKRPLGGGHGAPLVQKRVVSSGQLSSATSNGGGSSGTEASVLGDLERFGAAAINSPTSFKGALTSLWNGKGDVDAYFAFFMNALLQLMVIQNMLSALLGSLGPTLVAHHVLPGIAFTLLCSHTLFLTQSVSFGSFHDRTDLCAQPHGLNSMTLFPYIQLILTPAYSDGGNDPLFAYYTTLCCCFYHAVFLLILAPIGPLLRRVLPPSSLFATLAGTAIAFLSMDFAFQIFQAPLTGLIPLGIVFYAFGAEAKLPVPGGALALVAGLALQMGLNFTGLRQITGSGNIFDASVAGGASVGAAGAVSTNGGAHPGGGTLAAPSLGGVGGWTTAGILGGGGGGLGEDLDNSMLGWNFPHIQIFRMFQIGGWSGLKYFCAVGMPLGLLTVLSNIGALESTRRTDAYDIQQSLAIDAWSCLFGKNSKNDLAPAIRKKKGLVAE